jgi:murein DD-endopeptidase MepM/ murein hydrolase activator NlpD
VGVPLIVTWPSGSARIVTEAKSGEPFAANYPMSPSRNEFSVRVDDGKPSETVKGIGMGADTPGGFNAGIHTSTVLIFELETAASIGAPQPSTPVKQPTSAVPTLVHPIEDPSKRIISQKFGENPAAYARFNMAGHNGLDFAVPVGTPIRAVDDGVAVEMLSDVDGYGQYIKLKHSWGESLYAHLDRYNAVAQGAHVKRGQVIGLSGNSGNSTGPHLHLGIRINPYTRGAPYDGYSDPEPLLASTSEPSKPQPTTDILTLIKSVATEFGLEWQLLASLVMAESSFDRVAVSSAGALGLLQLMPGTFAEWKDRVGASDPLNARDNLRVGAAYFTFLVRHFNGDIRKALWAYNFGPGNVSAGRTPPAETIEFASRVIHGRDLLKAIGA